MMRRPDAATAAEFLLRFDLTDEAPRMAERSADTQVEYLDVKAAAMELGCSESTLRRYVNEGLIDADRFGLGTKRRIRFSPEQLAAAQAKLSEPTPAEPKAPAKKPAKAKDDDRSYLLRIIETGSPSEIATLANYHRFTSKSGKLR